MKISLTSYDVVGPARGSRSGNAFVDRDFASSVSSPRCRRSALPSSKCRGRRKRSSSRDDSFRWRRIVAVPALEPCHSSTRFSPAVVPVPAVVPRQAAVQILRGRVRTLPERSLVSTTRFHEHHAPAIRFRRAASLLTALRPAAQMFAQPFPQSAATAAAVVPRLANPPRRRRISPVLAPATRKEKMENVRKFDFSENKWGK